MDGLLPRPEYRPKFFIEQAGRIAQEEQKVKEKRQAEQAVLCQQHMVCAAVTQQLTQHIQFANDFYPQHVWNMAEQSQHEDDFNWSDPDQIMHLIRFQFRKSLSLLTHHPRERMDIPSFLSWWQLLHALVHKQTIHVDKVLLSGTQHGTLQSVLQLCETYEPYANDLIELEKQFAHPHSLHVRIHFTGVFSKQEESMVVSLAFADCKENVKLVNSYISNHIYRNYREACLSLDRNMMSRTNDIDLRILQARPDNLFDRWQHRQRRLWALRSNNLRQIDQAMSKYCHKVILQAEYNTSIFDELLYLARLQASCLHYLLPKQGKVKRITTFVALEAWINKRFQEQGNTCLSQHYYDVTALPDKQAELDFYYQAIHQTAFTR